MDQGTDRSVSETSVRPLEDRFGDFLQSRGMRNTRQRDLVLRAVISQQGPFDAEQLIAQIPDRGVKQRVSRPTVYRTLGEFLEAGLLRKFELDGRSLYAVDNGRAQTEHFLCLECKQFLAVDVPGLDGLRDLAAHSRQFQVLGHRFVIEGVCNECRQKKRRQRKRVDLI